MSRATPAIRTRGRKWQRGALVVATLLLVASQVQAARGPKLEVQFPRGPHYAGDPIDIAVTASGFEEDLQPQLDAPVRGNARLRLRGVSPSTNTSINIVNGRMTRTREVKYVFRLQLVANAQGRVEVGPFLVTQTGSAGDVAEATAPAVPLNIQTLPKSDDLGVELRIPDRPIYVGQRVPVELRFRMTRALQKGVERYTLGAPLFELDDAVRFEDAEEEGDLTVNLATARGVVEFPATVNEQEFGGKDMLEFTIQRTLIPASAGTLEIPPASLVVERATAWQRDIFGRRVASRTGKLIARDLERSIEVRDVPAEGRPPGFAGAVGKGFSLEVSADRTVVQVGEPIGLDLVLRGGGALESASFPPLDAPGLLPPDQFRAPGSELAGVVRDGAKRFRTTVRVLDPKVREIPALTYACSTPRANASRRHSLDRSPSHCEPGSASAQKTS